MLSYLVIGGLFLLVILLVWRNFRLGRELSIADRRTISAKNDVYALNDILCATRKHPQELWFKLAGFSPVSAGSHFVKLYVQPSIEGSHAKICIGHNLKTTVLDDLEVISLQGCMPELFNWKRVAGNQQVVLMGQLYDVAADDK